MNNNIPETEDVIILDTHKVIDSLRELYADMKKKKIISIDKAYEIVEKAYPQDPPSRTTIARVFRKNGGYNFRWEMTIRPIANAFLRFEAIDKTDNPEIKALKSILKLKKDTINELSEELTDEKEQYQLKLEDKITSFQKSIDFAKKQIAFKDKRIDQLLDANDRLQKIIDRLTEQLLACPCRNKDEN